MPHPHPPRRKAFVLLSGGLDSTTMLYQARHDYSNNIKAYSVDYGQRHIKEAVYAKQTCDTLKIEHEWILLNGILGKSMLTDPWAKVPEVAYSELKGVSPTYVPNRNMVMLSALTAKAQLWVNEELAKQDLRNECAETFDGPVESSSDVQAGVYFGAHADDALNWAYPDCTPEFIGAMANAIYVATYHHVRLHTPLQWLTKAGIVTLGHELKVPFENTWSCYKGEELHCGTCPTCRSRKEAFQIAGVKDPTIYQGHGDETDRRQPKLYSSA